MNTFIEILISQVSTVSDLAGTVFACFPDASVLFTAANGGAAVLASGIIASGNIPDAVLAAVRKWHGTIGEQFSCIDNVCKIIQQPHPAWNMPVDLKDELLGNCVRLDAPVKKCQTNAASSDDRMLRNSLLKATVGLCLLRVKGWAYGDFAAGNMTADEVHSLGFLLPGEHGGYHGRTEATDVLAEVKAKVINGDFVHVVIDQSAGENAGPVKHGWPQGVKHALIVIIAADGKTEVLRQLTTHLHNDIQMPEGTHGKQFVIRAAFLKHIDDKPRFGNGPTFSMPLTTEDLVAALDRQHHEEFEVRMQEVERQRREIERLQAELNAKNASL
jgi:hypothetical protein